MMGFGCYAPGGEYRPYYPSYSPASAPPFTTDWFSQTPQVTEYGRPYSNYGSISSPYPEHAGVDPATFADILGRMRMVASHPNQMPLPEGHAATGAVRAELDGAAGRAVNVEPSYPSYSSSAVHPVCGPVPSSNSVAFDGASSDGHANSSGFETSYCRSRVWEDGMPCYEWGNNFTFGGGFGPDVNNGALPTGSQAPRDLCGLDQGSGGSDVLASREKHAANFGMDNQYFLDKDGNLWTDNHLRNFVSVSDMSNIHRSSEANINSGATSHTVAATWPLPEPQHGVLCGGVDNGSAISSSLKKGLLSDRGAYVNSSDNFSGMQSFLYISPHDPSLVVSSGEGSNVARHSETSESYNLPLDPPCLEGPTVSNCSSSKTQEFTCFQDLDKPRGFDISSHFHGAPFCPRDAVKESSIEDSRFCNDSFLNQFSKTPMYPGHESYNVAREEFVDVRTSGNPAAQSSKSIVEAKEMNDLSSCRRNKPLLKPSLHFQQTLPQDLMTSENVCPGELDSCLGLCHAHSKRYVHADSHEPIAPKVPKVNVLSLVDTVRSVSKLLLHKCASEKIQLTEEVCKTLKDSIDDLNKCIQSAGSEPKDSKETHFHQDLLQVSATGSEATSFNQCDGVVGVKDDKTIKDIKNILQSTLSEEDEVQPQALLYRSLWLEAEAALCAATCRSHFNQMKKKMEKENSLSARSVSQCKTSTVPSTVTKLEPGINKGLTLESANWNLPIAGSSGHEDAVMARLHILVNLVNNSKAVKAANSTHSPDFSLPDTDDETESEANACQTDTLTKDARDVMTKLDLLTPHLDRENPEDAEDTVEMSSYDLKPRFSESYESSAQEKHSLMPDMLLEKFLRSSSDRHSGEVEASETFVSVPINHSDVAASVMARYGMLKSRTENSNSTNYEPEELLLGIDRKPILQDNLTAPANKSDDIAASVMARFHVLRSRSENSSSRHSDTEPLLPWLNMEPVFKNDSVGRAQLLNDMPDSVMARFHVLKTRVGNSISTDSASEPLPWVDMEHILQDNTFSPIQHERHLVESYFSAEDVAVIPPAKAEVHEDIASTSIYGEPSSEWEHVNKEEFPGHDC